MQLAQINIGRLLAHNGESEAAFGWAYMNAHYPA